MGGGWWILMMVLWIGLIAAFAWAGARLVARTGPVNRSSGAGERPAEILERRLASGEIDAQTYDSLHEKLHP